MLVTSERQRAAAMLEVIRKAREAAAVEPPGLREFVEHCLIIDKETGELVPFALWPEQVAALEAVEREDFLVWPKGRQIGATWLELAAMLWAGSFWGHRLFPIARQSDEYAQEAIGRLLILAGYDPNSDPPNMRVLPESPMPEAWRPKIVGKTARSLTLLNGSRYKALTATRSIARGDAAYWTLCDEYAFWAWPEKQLAALEHGAHRVHVVSTGEGEDDAFHKLFQKALQATGKWRQHFTPATADPRRTPEWFRTNVDESPTPDLARRELARTIEDVFRPVEGSYFSQFSRERHVREFDIVDGWEHSKALDFGLVRPFVLWVEVSPAGQPFVYDEWGPEQIDTHALAEGIHTHEQELLDEEGVVLHPPSTIVYCDPAGKGRQSQSSRSEFDVMGEHGFYTVGTRSEVRDGCDLIRNSLVDQNLRLVIHPRCVGLIRAMSQMPPDKADSNVYNQKHPVLSHPVDALRYWMVNNRAGSEPYRAPASDRPITASILGRVF